MNLNGKSLRFRVMTEKQASTDSCLRNLLQFAHSGKMHPSCFSNSNASLGVMLVYFLFYSTKRGRPTPTICPYEKSERHLPNAFLIILLHIKKRKKERKSVCRQWQNHSKPYFWVELVVQTQFYGSPAMVKDNYSGC